MNIKLDRLFALQNWVQNKRLLINVLHSSWSVYYEKYSTCPQGPLQKGAIGIGAQEHLLYLKHGHV